MWTEAAIGYGFRTGAKVIQYSVNTAFVEIRNDHDDNVRLAKQQFCTCSTRFGTFLCRHCTTTTWIFLIRCVMEVVNTRRRVFVSFSKPEWLKWHFCCRRLRWCWSSLCVYYGLFRYVLSNNLITVKSGRTFWFTCVDKRSLKLTCNCAVLFASDFLYAFCLERVDVPVTVALQYFAPLIAK